MLWWMLVLCHNHQLIQDLIDCFPGLFHCHDVFEVETNYIILHSLI